MTDVQIKPTIGRVVWFYDHSEHSIQSDKSQPLDAHIVYVHSDMLINIAGFDQSGVPFAKTSVFLRPDSGHTVAGHASWCEWMPYQQMQAAKHDSDALAKAAQMQSGAKPSVPPKR